MFFIHLNWKLSIIKLFKFFEKIVPFNHNHGIINYKMRYITGMRKRM